MSRFWSRARLAWLPPYQILLAALGILAGVVPGLPPVRLSPDLVLSVFVPALVFEAALNLDLRAVRAMARPIVLLATAGVVISIGLVALGVHAALGLAWPSALLLGAILSPTDPIAVVAVVRRSGAPGRLAALLEGESLLNDGTGVAAFTAVVASISTGSLSAPEIGVRFLVLSLGGLAIGAAVGLAGAVMIRHTRRIPLEVLITLVVAYGSYGLASRLGAGGVIAVVAAGVAMARVATWGPDTERWWTRIAILLSVVLFTLIGVALPAVSVLGMLGAVGVTMAILLGARLVPVYLLGFGISHRWRQLLWWGGVRGALSVALALAVTGQHGVDRAVPVIAYGVVGLSLLLQGSLIRPAVRAMRLT